MSRLILGMSEWFIYQLSIQRIKTIPMSAIVTAAIFFNAMSKTLVRG